VITYHYGPPNWWLQFVTDGLLKLKSGGLMVIRLPQWGLAFIAAGALWPIAAGHAQDTSDSVAKDPAASSNKADALQDDIEERSIQRRNRNPRPHKVHDADPWKKHPPVWSIRDVTKDHHPYAHPSSPAPGGGHYPGGPSGQFGQPYYYTAVSPDTSGTGPGGPGFAGGGMPMGGPGYGGGFGAGYGGIGNYPAAGGYPAIDGLNGGPGFNPGYGGGYGPGPALGPAAGPGFGGPGYGPALASGYGGYGSGGGYGYGGGQPGGFGAPNFAALPGQLPGDPYYYHFGPGFYRAQEAGHYRFPYYSYRRPWYFPGHTSYNRDTNIPW
jgi:hypothetical protein